MFDDLEWVIWSSFQPMLSFPRPISRKLYTIRQEKLKLLTRNHTTVFMCYNCRWPCRYFKVIRLFHIKFLVNDAWYGKSYYRLLIGNHTLAFDWCHFWWPWRTFKGHFSPGCHFSDGVSRHCTRYIYSYWNYLYEMTSDGTLSGRQ